MSIHLSVAGQNLMKIQLPVYIRLQDLSGRGLNTVREAPEANILGLRGGYLVTWNYVDFPCLF